MGCSPNHRALNGTVWVHVAASNKVGHKHPKAGAGAGTICPCAELSAGMGKGAKHFERACYKWGPNVG